MKTHYADGTYLETTRPWSLFCSGAALCPDGKVRKLKRIATTADTFFSIPAAVTFKGKTIAGFVSVDTLNNPQATVKFTPYAYRKNGHLFDSPENPPEKE